jgi:hypothetical protein
VSTEPIRLWLESAQFRWGGRGPSWFVPVLRGVVWALVVAGFIAFLLVGADRPLRPHLTNVYLPGWHPPAPSHP